MIANSKEYTHPFDTKSSVTPFHLFIDASTSLEPSIEPCADCRNINSQRHPIPDVPALYLLEPTPKNLQLINSDLSKSLYSDAYINFLSSIPRPLMEDFADELATAGNAEGISQLYDQYLNFIVSEPDLFSLGLGAQNYQVLNSARTKDEEIDAAVDRIVSGLFSVVVTMGEPPRTHSKCR